MQKAGRRHRRASQWTRAAASRWPQAQGLCRV